MDKLFKLLDGTMLPLENIDYIGPYNHRDATFSVHTKSGNGILVSCYRPDTHTYRPASQVKMAYDELVNSLNTYLTTEA